MRLRLQSPILCQRCLQVFILSLVVGWGWSLVKTFLSRLKMLLVNDTEDTKSLLSYRLPSCRAPRKLWLQSLCLHSHQQVRIYIRLFWPLKYWTFFRMGLQHSFKRRKLNSQNRSIQQNGEFEYREGWGGRDWIVNEYKCDQFFPLLSLLFEEWWYQGTIAFHWKVIAKKLEDGKWKSKTARNGYRQRMFIVLQTWGCQHIRGLMRILPWTETAICVKFKV